jgi:hypothetical protein
MSNKRTYESEEILELKSFFRILDSGGRLNTEQRRRLRQLEDKLKGGASLGQVAAGVGIAAAGFGLLWALSQRNKSGQQSPKQWS